MKHLTLALVGGLLLALVGLVATAVQPGGPAVRPLVAQEPVGGAPLAPAGGPGFALAITPSQRAVFQGESAFYRVTVSVLPTHTSAITLSVQGTPTGAEAALNPNPVWTTTIVHLAMTTSLTTPVGTWPLTVTGQSKGISLTVPFTLQVRVPVTPDFGLSVQPAEGQLMRRCATTFTLSTTALSGFASPVTFTVGGLPSGTASSLKPAFLTPPGEAILTLSATYDAPSGTHRLVITGSSGDLTHTTPLTLTILPLHSTFLPAIMRGYDYLCLWDEPNDTLPEAIPLSPYREYESYICPQDPRDFFSVSLQSLTPIVISLTNLVNLPPGVDYDLYLHDSAGGLVAWSNQYGQVDEYIIQPIAQAGVYYIQVLPYSGHSRQVPYHLTASFDYEPNNDLSSAYGPLQLGRSHRAYLWSAADFTDYYYVDIPTLSTVAISLTNLVNLPPGVDYDLYLLNSAGELIAWSNQYGQVDEHLAQPITETGRYYIQVLAYSGFTADIPYRLIARLEQ